ncbi:Predicted branched-chain amino acid permease (azaleucine resistance) [Oribacterium sp. KHPX15]|uniref:AzlC family ABC transporter permease n=1 Tax=unclassified Oribacterium TaxID=2629782 RepID=UPI000678AF74|nr:MULTISPECIES: AzlC family ABC transporter permease [unclassified Oribacterium]SEA46746.1 Predicted branched-chain amino acid permease (azaleucine resistance) [Oribacterium sp. KHPX15]
MKNNRHWFLKGLKDGIPIAIGYFAVSFALGFFASNAGLTVFQATLSSLLCNASAGEYAGFVGIASKVSYLTMAAMIAIVNIRYLLMSASLSQKLPEETSLPHRLLVGFWITDEIFAASISVPGKLNPFYSYGLAISSLSFWALGTCLGAVVGNVVPDNVVSALGVLLYGMFLAIIIPPARENKILRFLIIIAMFSSFAFSKLPVLSSISNAIRITILTIVISGAAALIFPIKGDEDKLETGADVSHEAGEVKNAQ